MRRTSGELGRTYRRRSPAARNLFASSGLAVDRHPSPAADQPRLTAGDPRLTYTAKTRGVVDRAQRCRQRGPVTARQRLGLWHSRHWPTSRSSHWHSCRVRSSWQVRQIRGRAGQGRGSGWRRCAAGDPCPGVLSCGGRPGAGWRPGPTSSRGRRRRWRGSRCGQNGQATERSWHHDGPRPARSWTPSERGRAAARGGTRPVSAGVGGVG